MKRRWLLGLLAVAFVWVVISRFTEIEKLAATLAEGRWQWVLVAGLLQVLYQVAYAGLYQAAFRTVGVKSRLRDLLPVVFASYFVNVTAPSAGASGAALFVDDAVQRGESGARTAAGALLLLLAEFGVFVPILGGALVFLKMRQALQLYEIVGALMLFGLVGFQAAVLIVGLRQATQLRRLFGWLQATVNRVGGWFRRPDLLAASWADENATEFAQAAQAITQHPARLLRTLCVAAAAHLVDLMSLYALFLAFYQPVEPGVILAAYAAGMLFWFVSPTPQGVGVVEGLMPLALVSLGLPGEKATVIALAFRGLGFWLPFALGFFLLRYTRSFGWHSSARGRRYPHRTALSVHVLSLLIALMGIINLVSAVTPTLSDRLTVVHRLLPVAVRTSAHLTAALLGFALLLLARNLWRHKQVAWVLTMIVLGVSAVSHLVKGLDYEEALVATALMAWLGWLRPHFHARSDRPSIWQGLQTLLLALAFTLAYGMVGFYLLDRHFAAKFGLGAALRQTVIMFTQFYDPGLQPVTGFGRYFAGSIYGVAATTLAYALWMLFRPVVLRGPATPSARAQAHSIVEAFGQSSLARIALFDDKAYFFSTGGAPSVIAYVVRGRVALALGDPIGPAADAASAIQEFRAYCARNDWRPAFYQTLPDLLEHYREAGLTTLCIGHEAIVDLATFSLAGGANKKLRLVINRLTKLGYRAEHHAPPLSDEMLDELRDISDEWLTLVEGSEKRFSLGWFDDAYIRTSPILAIHDTRDEIVAFANLVSEYQRNELTIDLMRHRRAAEPGTMEFLFSGLLDWAHAAGYTTFNLGLCALSGIGENKDDPTVERALHYVYEHVNRYYNFRGLHDFKAKFHPTWSPRYLIYPSAANLAAVVVALLEADAGHSLFWRWRRPKRGEPGPDSSLPV